MPVITYDFESDTIGSQPANTTVIRGVSPTTQDSAVLGTKALQLPSTGGAKTDIQLDLVEVSAELDLELRIDTTVGSASRKIGVVVNMDATFSSGYLIQWDEIDDRVEIYKRDVASPYIQTVIINSSTGLSSATTNSKWRVTVTRPAGSTIITVYSWNGVTWSQYVQASDSTYPLGRLGVSLPTPSTESAYIDDIVVNYSTPTIIVDTPRYFTNQRKSNTKGDVPVSGTYVGSPTAIEARFNGGPWQEIDSAPINNMFAGTLTDQNVGQGLLETRFVNDTTVSTTVPDVGIGDVYVVAGQSNAEGRATNPKSYTNALGLKATVFREDGFWADGNDPTDIGTVSGSVWPLVASQIMNYTNLPVAFITTAKGATGLVFPDDDWAKGGDGSGSYENMLTQVSASRVTGTKAVLWHQGERDAKNAISQSQYKSSLQLLAANLRVDIASSPPLMVAQIGEMNGSNDVPRNDHDAIRSAQAEAWADDYILPGPVVYDIGPLADGIHFQSDSQIQAVADRWWASLSENVYGQSGGRGPQILALQHNSAKTQLILTFVIGSGTLLPATLIDGFRVTDDGVEVGIAEVNRTAANEIRIDLIAAASGTLEVSLGSHNDGVGGAVPIDSSSFTLPAEPFRMVAVPRVSMMPWIAEAVKVFATGGVSSRSINSGSPELQAVILAKSSPLFMARIVDAVGKTITADHVSSIEYTIHQLDPDSQQPTASIIGHTSVALSAGDVVLSDPRRDYAWADVDRHGYNFSFRPDIRQSPAFSIPGRFYRVETKFTTDSAEIFLLRYRITTV